jgi:hypothetical protein
MFQRRAFFPYLSALICLFAWALPAASCGVERWSVKTGSDSDAGVVNLTSATPTTISDLRGLSYPSPVPKFNRVSPTETTVWVINATLKEFAKEKDEDYHLVISDDTGNTMIVEIPEPNCVNASSPFAAAIANARAEFDAQFTATSSFQSANIPVQVKGVGMFDFVHHPPQRGVAPNAVELHPVLDVVFNPSGDFSMLASPTSLTAAQGATGSSTVSATATSGFSSAVSLSASALPTGITASFSPASVSPPASAAITLSVAPTVAPGTYSLTVTGNGGGQTHSATLALTVVPSGAGPASTVTNPPDGSTVSGQSINVMAQSSTGMAVSKLEVYVDGVIRACGVDAASISFSWDSTKVSNGPHTIVSKAYDAAGNVGASSTITVIVSN